jgi:RNA polymerase sigma-70 factor (ECF subfamily)
MPLIRGGTSARSDGRRDLALHVASPSRSRPDPGRRVDGESVLLQDSAATGADAEPGLVDAAVAGDSTAFAALYDRHLDRVYRHVYYRVGNRSDAEDLTQQVFLQAWRAIGRYHRTGAPFIAWLLTIAHNAVVSHYRKVKDTPRLEIEPVASRDGWSDPEAAALAEHDRAAVRRAIQRLKQEQQLVVTMRFIEGFDYTDVAAVLGKREGNVRVIQHRALVELRRLLAAEIKG